MGPHCTSSARGIRFTLLASLLWHSASSVPVEASLQSRQCGTNESGVNCDYLFPTLSDIVSRVRDVQHGGQASPNTSSCFWTGFDIMDHELYRRMLYWLDGFAIPDCYFEYWSHQPVDKIWYKEQLAYISNHEAMFRDNNPKYQLAHDQFDVSPRQYFLWCYWQSLAAASMNPIAILFAPGDHYLSNTSAWIRIEIPALTNNPNIERIYRADPFPWRRGPHTGYPSPELLWQRGRDQPLSQAYPAFNCSV